MANKATTGTNPSQITFVSVSTLEKRIRRHLAGEYLQLRKNRPGTYQLAEHGLWTVIDPRANSLIERRVSLAELAEKYGLLADNEMLDAPQPPGWVWQVVRQSVVTEDGKRILRHEPISEIFKNQAEAYQAAAKIGADGVAVVGFAPIEAGDRQEGDDETPR